MAELMFTKLDSARRQLELAIELYFDESDPVSIHTLAAASNELLRGLTKQVDEDPMLKDYVLSWVKDDHKRAVVQKLVEAQNFFKHADRDPATTLSFDPGQSEIVITSSGQQSLGRRTL